MLHLPNDGYKIYECAIYNQKVRELVDCKRRHSHFDDRWATVQRRDVVARDETEALSLIAERFPPEDGFVVKGISVSPY
jgi:hypothetical protein